MTVQQFNLVDVLRLEIERTPVGLVNLCQNPDGDLGGWAFITPLTSSAVSTSVASGQQFLHYTRGVAGASNFTTELLPVTAGQFVAAYYRAYSTSDWHRCRFEWYNAAGALLSSSVQSGYILGGPAVTGALGPIVAPASTAYVKLRFDVYLDNLGNPPVSANALNLFDVTVAKAATSGALAGLGPLEPAEYTNVIGSAGASLEVDQAALDVGALKATLYDIALDPSTNTLLRPGRRARLHYYDGSAWLPLFTGKLSDVKVKYDLLDPTTKRAQIDLLAVDNIAVMAARSEPRGVSTVSELRTLLEGKGVPWNCNGRGDQNANPINLRAVSDDARLLDQVAMTRDTVLGFAWVDRYGVVQVWDSASLSTTPYGTLIDENAYSDINVEYDTERIINEATITVVRTKASGETVETIHGPYRSQTSIDTWGVFHADFRIVSDGTAPATQASTLATTILARNDTPAIRINSVTLPIRTTLERTRWCGVGLYQLVEISNTIAGIVSMDMRVTGIHHRIEATVWTVTYDLEVVASVAAPRRSATMRAAYSPETVPYLNRNRTATQSVATATWTTIAAGAAREGSGVDQAAGVYTITTDGLYAINVCTEWLGNATGRRATRILINGTSEAFKENRVPDASDFSHDLVYFRRLVAGDTVTPQIWQNVGVALTTLADPAANNVQVVRVGD